MPCGLVLDSCTAGLPRALPLVFMLLLYADNICTKNVQTVVSLLQWVNTQVSSLVQPRHSNSRKKISKVIVTIGGELALFDAQGDHLSHAALVFISNKPYSGRAHPRGASLS